MIWDKTNNNIYSMILFNLMKLNEEIVFNIDKFGK